MWRVVEETQRNGVVLSPFSLIPKKGKPGKWQLIVNLLAPEGSSVNDGIDRRLATTWWSVSSNWELEPS